MQVQKDAVHLSAQLQQNLSQKITNVSTYNSLRSPLFESLFRPTEEQQRSPFSGVTMKVANLDARQSSKLSKVAERALKQTRRLNPLIIEAWINNSIGDSESMDVASAILNTAHLRPLDRYGVSRSLLLQAGMPDREIDKLYRSLLVYSLGFYQVVLDLLRHTDNKYSIVANVWKVFTILLEHCCHLDYKTMVTHLQMDLNKEVEAVSKHFTEKFQVLKEREQKLLEKASNASKEAETLQKDLKQEIAKRVELEEELNRKGNGHEHEVKMRLQFEARLNQMYAWQRDFDIRSAQLMKTLKTQETQLQEQSEQLSKFQEKTLSLKQERIRLREEISRLETKIENTADFQAFYEEKVRECYDKVQDAQTTVSEMQSKMDVAVNELSQQSLQNDNLQCEIELQTQQNAQLQEQNTNLKEERSVLETRVKELEQRLASQLEHFRVFRQEYARFEERNKNLQEEVDRFTNIANDLRNEKSQLHDQKDSLNIHLQAAEEKCNGLTEELALAQKRIEEMNKGRRRVEDRNEFLLKQMALKDIEVQETRDKSERMLEEQTNDKETINALRNEINTLQVKLKSSDKQALSLKNTFGEKVKALTDILQSERSVKDEWIHKFEDHMKIHNQALYEKASLQEQLNQVQIQLHSVTAYSEEYKAERDRLLEKTTEQMNELLEIRPHYEEILRRMKTQDSLSDIVQKEHEDKVAELLQKTQDLKQETVDLRNKLGMREADIWQHSHLVYSALVDKQEECDHLNIRYGEMQDEISTLRNYLEVLSKDFERKAFVTEELWHNTLQLEDTIQIVKEESSNHFAKYSETLEELNLFKSMIPEDIREEENPFEIFQSRMSNLQAELERIEEIKRNSVSKFMQTQIFYSNVEVQTNPMKGEALKKAEAAKKQSAFKQPPKQASPKPKNPQPKTKSPEQPPQNSPQPTMTEANIVFQQTMPPSNQNMAGQYSSRFGNKDPQVSPRMKQMQVGGQRPNRAYEQPNAQDPAKSTQQVLAANQPQRNSAAKDSQQDRNRDIQGEINQPVPRQGEIRRNPALASSNISEINESKARVGHQDASSSKKQNIATENQIADSSHVNNRSSRRIEEDISPRNPDRSGVNNPETLLDKNIHNFRNEDYSSPEKLDSRLIRKEERVLPEPEITDMRENTNLRPVESLEEPEESMVNPERVQIKESTHNIPGAPRVARLPKIPTPTIIPSPRASGHAGSGTPRSFRSSAEEKKLKLESLDELSTARNANEAIENTPRGSLTERLPKIRRDSRQGEIHHHIPFTEALLPHQRSQLPTDIKRYMKQAHSRRSSDFDFM